MGKGKSGLEAAEKRLACEIDGALRGGSNREPRLAALSRALAPHSSALRGVLAETARVFLKRGAFECDLYGASLRALADADDKRLAPILKTALAGEEAGNLPALSAACFVGDGALAPLLGRAAASSKAQVSFGAEVARMCRGELSGSRLASLAPKIKEAHRIALCVEVLLPITQRTPARASDKCAPVADALRVLQSAERHLGRWLVMGEIAHRTGDRRSLDEAIEKATSGPHSSRGAWSFVGWALDPKSVVPAARPTAEVVARLSHRPSADKDSGFLFRLGEAGVEAAVPTLESLVRTRPLEDEVAVRAAFVLAKFYGISSMEEPIKQAAEHGARDGLRGVAAAALWDLGCQEQALATACALAESECTEALVWSALVGCASKKSNGHAHDPQQRVRVLDEPTFRRVRWGWPE